MNRHLGFFEKCGRNRYGAFVRAPQERFVAAKPPVYCDRFQPKTYCKKNIEAKCRNVSQKRDGIDKRAVKSELLKEQLPVVSRMIEHVIKKRMVSFVLFLFDHLLRIWFSFFY